MDTKAIMALVVERFGGKRSVLARAIGTSRSNLGTWSRRGVPAKFVLKLALAAGVKPHDIRPDLYPEGLVQVAQ